MPRGPAVAGGRGASSDTTRDRDLAAAAAATIAPDLLLELVALDRDIDADMIWPRICWRFMPV